MMKFRTVGLIFPLALVFFVLLPHLIRAKLCSDVKSKGVIKEVTYKDPCLKKYTARCGWLSLNYCTFYHHTFCDKKKNDTVTTYYVVTKCCKGYYKAANGSCIVLGAEGEPIYTTKAPEYVVISNGGNYTEKVNVEVVKAGSSSGETTLKKLKVSGGGYAGIICGFVFVCAVTFFIIRAIRKRQLRQSTKQKPNQSMAVEYKMAPSSPPTLQVVPQERQPLAATAEEAMEASVTELKEDPETNV